MFASSMTRRPDVFSLLHLSGLAVGGCPACGRTAGQVGWVSLTLAPGRYELVCNLQDHYADGMHQEFTVT